MSIVLEEMCVWSDTNCQSLVMGLQRALVLVHTCTCLTSHLESGTRLGPMSLVISSMIGTTLNAFTKFLLLVYFCRSWSSGNYSFVHLFQNKSAELNKDSAENPSDGLNLSLPDATMLCS